MVHRRANGPEAFSAQRIHQAACRGGLQTPLQSWGYGYTEGDAWSYAFLAPQDGQGLANLYGGRQKLKEKLDTFFTTDPGLDGGSYGMIHEVREAKKVDELANLGEYQHSNQPVHHSIYMYNYAGAPANGQKYLRDVMDKLYFTGFGADGVSNGEGYIGDEDNGEQSAWYVLSAMGIYPVSVGRPEYAIGAPYFPK
jgi:putative alpha-1,2-mannosidase